MAAPAAQARRRPRRGAGGRPSPRASRRIAQALLGLALREARAARARRPSPTGAAWRRFCWPGRGPRPARLDGLLDVVALPGDDRHGQEGIGGATGIGLELPASAASSACRAEALGRSEVPRTTPPPPPRLPRPWTTKRRWTPEASVVRGRSHSIAAATSPACRWPRPMLARMAYRMSPGP